MPSADLAIDRVDPGFGPSTQSVAVKFDGSFHMPLTSNLDKGGTVAGQLAVTVGGRTVADAVWRDEQLIEGTIAPGLPSGPADVTVTIGDLTDMLPGGYNVDGTGPAVSGDTRQLVIDGSKVIGGPHSDFPIVVGLSDPWLRSMASGGHVAHPQGFDIFFSADPAGTIRLAHEIERYTEATGALVAWVKIPSLSATTTLYIHAGDTTVTTSLEDRPGVWSANFAGVWHLTDLSDSTARNPGTDGGTSTAGGRIESARLFNGTSSLISIGSSASVDNIFDGGGTVEGWFFATGTGQNGFGRVFEKGIAGGMTLAMCDGNNVPHSVLFAQVFSSQTINWCTSANTIALNTWFHVAVVYDDNSVANRPLIYVNGVSVPVNGGQPAGSRVSDAGDTLFIGNRQAGARAFAGTIDEAHVSRAPRDAGWIATTYANQRDPGSFCSFAP
jgi:hypothetical protein